MTVAPPTETPAPAPMTGQPNADQRKKVTLTDAEIVAVTSAANTGEIEMAKLATKTSQNAQVKAFANMMINEHTEAETKGKKIAQAAKLTPTDNDVSTKLKSSVETTMTTLKAKKGTDFDREYMDAQVHAHQDVLSAIDDTLLPSAQNPDLKSHLGDVRGHVVKHLARAQEISQSLSGTVSTPMKR